MSSFYPILKRELKGYFATPVAYVFIVIFLFINALFTFQLGRFFEMNQATLTGFFMWHPWLYLFLIPAVSMRLWAEERKSGTIELLLTQPVTLAAAVLAKFLAAWAFIAIALILTLPIVFTVAWLGDPDLGVVFVSYVGSFLMAGAFLSIGIFTSALSKDQAVSFIISLVISLIFVLAGFDVIIDFFSAWAPEWLLAAVSSMGFLTHHMSIMKGIVSFQDVLFYLSLTAGWLTACGFVLEAKKAQ